MTTPTPTRPLDPVSTCMTWPVTTVPGSATLQAAAETLSADEVGAAVVVEHGVVVGVLSERDIVRHVAVGADPDHLTALDVMSEDVVAVAPTDSIVAVAHQMVDCAVRHLPVLDAGRLAGMVSMRDVQQVLLEALDATVAR
jgi:CBS domain-containing protein